MSETTTSFFACDVQLIGSRDDRTVNVQQVGDQLHVTAELPMYLRSEPNMRGHWSKGAKRRAEQRDMTAFALTIARPALQAAAKAKSRFGITLTRVRPAKARILDDDNLRGACKAVRDGIADVIGLDDGNDRLTWRYQQAVATDYAVRIEIVSCLV